VLDQKLKDSPYQLNETKDGYNFIAKSQKELDEMDKQ
jgi:hypothetical protein